MMHILTILLFQMTFNCGSMVTLTANPDDGYEFDHWSDDLSITEDVRVIEVMSDTTVFAYFHEICDQSGNLPLVNRMNWVLMLDIDSLNRNGYYPDSIHCAWYRVVGVPDDLERPFPQNDVYLGSGLYYAKGESLMGNKYYCVMDLRQALAGKRCVKLQRSIIADLTGQRIHSATRQSETGKAILDGQLVLIHKGKYYSILGTQL